MSSNGNKVNNFKNFSNSSSVSSIVHVHDYSNNNINLNDNNTSNNVVDADEACNKNLFSKLFKTSKDKLVLTLVYCLVFWNFGICIALFGPTLLDLACQTASSLTAISWMYFIQNLTSLIGCFVSGILIKNGKISANNLLIICTILLPLFVSLMPIAKHIFFLGLIMAFMGFNMGCIDNVGNLLILKLHGSNVSPFIQGLHFFYGFGAFITPIVVQMFLDSNFDLISTSSALNCYSAEDVQEYIKLQQQLNNGTYELHPDLIISEMYNTKQQIKSRTKYAFWILSAIQLPVPIILFLFKFGKWQAINNELDSKVFASKASELWFENDNNDNNFEEISSSSNSCLQALQRIPSTIHGYIKTLFGNNRPVLVMTLVMAALVFIFDGLQAAMGGYIYSYSVEKYDLNIDIKSIYSKTNNGTSENSFGGKFNHKRNDDAYITASFWAFFSIGRLASIFIATKLTPSFMIFTDLIGCLIACLLMLISAFIESKNKFLIYFSSCIFGLFLSNTTPSSYSLAEIYIGMTPSLTSFVIISAATGEMLLPVIVGIFFESEGPTSFLIILLIATILAGIAFYNFWAYCRLHAHNFDAEQSFVCFKSTTNQTNDTKQYAINGEKSILVGDVKTKYYSRMTDEDD